MAAALAALAVALAPAAPARAATADGTGGGPEVVATDQMLVWDGSTEVFAVRWHLSAPVTRLDWLVATPSAATPTRVAPQTVRGVAAEAMPRDRWYVTHPWLLFDDAGRRARAGLTTTTTPDGAAPDVEAGTLGGAAEALDAARAVGGAPDAATRAWVGAALGRGWTLHRLTVTTPTPTTVVGPVALRFEAAAPVVLSSPLPRTGTVSLLTVAPRVLAAEQPALGAVAGAGAGGAGGAATPDPRTAAATGARPSFTVLNARTVRLAVADLPGPAATSGPWTVTALTGATGVDPVVLVPQDGPTSDWRSQVGVWWPGWGPAALAALVAGLVVALVVVGARRGRHHRPVVAHPPAVTTVVLPADPPGPPADLPLVDTRELDVVDVPDEQDTRPDIHRVT